MSEEIRHMQKKEHDHNHSDGRSDYSWGASALIWFIILVIFFVFILFVWKPKWVRSKGKHCDKDGGDGKHHKGGKVDLGRVILVAIIIAFLILILFWIVWQFSNKGGHSHHHHRKDGY